MIALSDYFESSVTALSVKNFKVSLAEIRGVPLWPFLSDHDHDSATFVQGHLENIFLQNLVKIGPAV